MQVDRQPRRIGPVLEILMWIGGILLFLTLMRGCSAVFPGLGVRMLLNPCFLLLLGSVGALVWLGRRLQHKRSSTALALCACLTPLVAGCGEREVASVPEPTQPAASSEAPPSGPEPKPVQPYRNRTRTRPAIGGIVLLARDRRTNDIGALHVGDIPAGGALAIAVTENRAVGVLGFGIGPRSATEIAGGAPFEGVELGLALSVEGIAVGHGATEPHDTGLQLAMRAVEFIEGDISTAQRAARETFDDRADLPLTERLVAAAERLLQTVRFHGQPRCAALVVERPGTTEFRLDLRVDCENAPLDRLKAQLPAATEAWIGPALKKAQRGMPREHPAFAQNLRWLARIRDLTPVTARH